MAGLSSLLIAARAGDAPVPRALAARVAARIAEGWRVPVEQLQLDWGRVAGETPDENAPFRVLGQGDDGWFVVVFSPTETRAVAVRVRAGIERAVPVATRPLPAGTTVGDGDVREEMRVHWGVPRVQASDSTLVGWEVRRPLRAGEVVGAPAVAPPPLVLAGRPVRLEWERGGVLVSVEAIALNSARRGETVRARLEERPAHLTATVTAPGTAVLEAGEIR